MDHISQFIVDLSWGLTFGALIAVGVVAAKASGVAAAALAALAVIWAIWKAVARRRR